MLRRIVLRIAIGSLGLFAGLEGTVRLAAQPGPANETKSLDRIIDRIGAQQGESSPKTNEAQMMAQAYLADGQRRMAIGELQGAIASYSVAISLEPRLVAAWWSRARIRQELGQLGAAIDDLNGVLALQPKSIVALFNRGQLKLLNDNAAGAVADLTAALALDPQFSTAYALRGQARAGLGEFAAAIADYDRALALGVVDAEEIRALRLKAETAQAGKAKR
jgi:tetratricopeptide (TPR) repeat protein